VSAGPQRIALGRGSIGQTLAHVNTSGVLREFVHKLLQKRGLHIVSQVLLPAAYTGRSTEVKPCQITSPRIFSDSADLNWTG
jgi:hypothetical protein